MSLSLSVFSSMLQKSCTSKPEPSSSAAITCLPWHFDLLKDFGVVSVRHCQPEKYYKHLLEPVTGPTTKQKRKRGEHALTFEVDAGALALEGAAATAAAAPVVQTVQRRVRGKRRDKAFEQDTSSAVQGALKDRDGDRGDRDRERARGSFDVPDAPPTSHANRDQRHKQKQVKSHAWGAGYLTFKPPNSWQATCHRRNSHKHALGKNTRCTRTRTFNQPEHEADVLRQLRHWLKTALQF